MIVSMAYGVLLSLDALGTQVSGNELENKVLNFDKVDRKIKKDTKKLIKARKLWL